jgi:hypothetical protein
MNLKSIMKQHISGIFLVVFFLFLENFTWLLEPTFFGKLLDALIDRFYNDDLKMNYVLPLSLWVVIYLLNAFGGALSRLYSGKIYSKLYVDMAGEVISSSTIKGYPPSRTLARAELAKEYVIFLKDGCRKLFGKFSLLSGVSLRCIFTIGASLQSVSP